MDQFIAEKPGLLLFPLPGALPHQPGQPADSPPPPQSAAFELPFERGERFGRENIEELLDYLTEKGVLHQAGERWHWSAESYPADEVSLRSINPENVVVVDASEQGNPRIIAEVDWDGAFTALHEGAIYMVESQPYQVDRLDLPGKKAYVRKVDVDYFTDAMTYTNVRVIDRFVEKREGSAIVEHGEVQVVRKVVGYKKIKFYTSENLGFGDVHLPERDMHTHGLLVHHPPGPPGCPSLHAEEIIDGLTGLAYGLHHLAAMLLMADLHDIDRCIGDKSGEWFVRHTGSGRVITSSPSGADEAEPAREDAFDPTVFLFDAYPGGIGFSDSSTRSTEGSWDRRRPLLSSCPCLHGCPSCVGPTLEVGNRAKEVALTVVNRLLEQL